MAPATSAPGRRTTAPFPEEAAVPVCVLFPSDVAVASAEDTRADAALTSVEFLSALTMLQRLGAYLRSSVGSCQSFLFLFDPLHLVKVTGACIWKTHG